jgi:guanylate kinase
MSSSGRGRLFIVSAPSGTGKTTIVRKLVASVPRLGISRSYTTRPIRPGEADGVDYNYVPAERFVAMREAGAFLEWAEVFGNCYGTGVEDTERRLNAGEDLLLVIDVQGAAKVRAAAIPTVGIFLLPPSYAVLESRLRSRSRDPEDQIQRRLATARREVHAAGDYDYVVVNDDIDGCVDCLRAIVIAERARQAAMKEEVERIAGTFAVSREAE